MTAFGFVVFIVGILVSGLFHEKYSPWTIYDTIASILISVGLISIIAEITIWLYRVMP